MEQTPLLERYRWVILIPVGIIILAVFGYFLLTQDEPVSITIHFPPPTGTHTPLPTLAVYVTGAVTNPESLYTLPPGARVEDAIEAAGGAAENADLSLINLARSLEDGEQIHIPAEGEMVSVPSMGSTIAILDLNTATLDQLDALPGIGPSTAQAILDYRTEVGGFVSVDELDNVRGIGAATLEEIRPLVTVIPLTVQGSATASQEHSPNATNTPSQTPRPTETPSATPAATRTPTPTEAGPLDINEATVEQLAALRGVGETIAEAIVDYRTEVGYFRSVDELDHVPGIGPSLLADIRDLVTVDEEFVKTLPTATTTGILLLNINTATIEELEALPGIGLATAREIVAYREENGPFESIQELDRVPGIGPAIIAEIEDLVTVE